MYFLALYCLTSLSLFALVNVALTTHFSRLLRNRRNFKEFANPPRVSVVLCLRGHDPFLERTLVALCNQDYSEFEIRIIVDHAQDPAWQTVRSIIERFPQRCIHAASLTERRVTCSLKCSAIVQAVEAMSSTADIIVLADADAVPYRNWLRQLLAPLVDEQIGVVSGCQWFSPHYPNLGSIIRQTWNTGAIVPTVAYGHPWAGSCAIRLADVHRSGLLEMWRKTIVDDGPIGEAMKRIGQKIYHHPDVVIVNREQCDLAFVVRYISRMLTWSRIYESAFFLTVVHMLGTVVVGIIAVFVILMTAVNGQWAALCIASFGLLTYAASNGFSKWQVDRAIATALNRRKELAENAGLAAWLRFLMAFPLTQLIYGWCVLAAIFTRRVTWRQATYQIRSKWDVALIQDNPFQAQTASDSSTQSI
jgi:glycosyltransferase involved in cell wall biosynthesis